MASGPAVIDSVRGPVELWNGVVVLSERVAACWAYWRSRGGLTQPPRQRSAAAGSRDD